MLGEELPLYYDRNLEELKKVIACAEKSAKIRKAEERARTNLISKSKFSIDTNGKLANCESRNPEECEVFIVEEIPRVVLQRRQETAVHRLSFHPWKDS